MTLTGDRGTHPEPTYPHSPEAADRTSSVGGPPAHFDTLARLLSVDPELVPAALANLIASERESARAEVAAAAVETFNAYVTASSAAHRAYRDYQFGACTPVGVDRANKREVEARERHLAALANTT